MMTNSGNFKVFSVDTAVRVNCQLSAFYGCVGVTAYVNMQNYYRETDVQIVHADTRKIVVITVPASILEQMEESHPDLEIIYGTRNQQLAVAAVKDEYLTEDQEELCSNLIDGIISHSRSIDEFLWKLKYEVFADGARKSKRFSSFDEICKWLHKEHRLLSPSSCYERAWAFEEKRILKDDLKLDLADTKLSVNTLLELRKESDLEKKRELFLTALHDFGGKSSITAKDIQEAKKTIDNNFTEQPPLDSPKPKKAIGKALEPSETITLSKHELEKTIEDAIAMALAAKQEEMIAYQIQVRESALSQAEQEISAREKRAEQKGKQEMLLQYQLALREIALLKQKLEEVCNMDARLSPGNLLSQT